MPLVEPTVLANGIDGLLLQVTVRPGVYMSAILPSTLSTLACEVDTHQLNHTLGEDVRGLHIRLAKGKHSHVTDVAFGGIGNQIRQSKS